MDPTATLQSILTLIKDAKGKEHNHKPTTFLCEDCDLCNDTQLVIDDLRNLATWLENGGFLPRI